MKLYLDFIRKSKWLRAENREKGAEKSARCGIHLGNYLEFEVGRDNEEKIMVNSGSIKNQNHAYRKQFLFSAFYPCFLHLYLYMYFLYSSMIDNKWVLLTRHWTMQSKAF